MDQVYVRASQVGQELGLLMVSVPLCKSGRRETQVPVLSAASADFHDSVSKSGFCRLEQKSVWWLRFAALFYSGTNTR